MSRGFLIGAFVVGLAGWVVTRPTPAHAEKAPASTGPAASAAARSGGPGRLPTTAQSSAPGAGGGTQDATERARLAAELDHINAEIDALKRSSRGIRDDYRLRSRMADAEAVARRLTELEARSGHTARTPGAAAPPATWPREIPIGAGDDRADLEAKADILADQAGRLTAEANRIEVRLVDLRARRELRRRAGQLERDPFSPLEQAKSRVVITGGGITAASTPGGTKSAGNPSRSGPGTGTDSATPTMGSSGSGPSAGGGPTAGGGTTTVAPPTNTGSTAGGTSSPGPAAGSGPQSGGSSITDSSASGTPISSGTGTTPVSAQLRSVLDPSALAEVRRLEAPGSGPANLPALESALGALRARSAELSRNAAALRARAAQRP